MGSPATTEDPLSHSHVSPTGHHAPTWRRAAAVAALALCAVALPAQGSDVVEAKKIFNQRCTACHTFGKGIKVGPDLKGVTARRDRAWLLAFVRSSQRVIAAHDPVATDLFERFKRQRMPDWTDLSEAQIGGILDWLAANGPEQKEIDERNAEEATTADIEIGRSLFHGRTPLAGGGMGCAGCHAIREADAMIGASFGPDLTHAYLKYHDRALTLLLRRPCVMRLPESSSSPFLLPQELFALKAYLRQAALPAESKRGAP